MATEDTITQLVGAEIIGAVAYKSLDIFADSKRRKKKRKR